MAACGQSEPEDSRQSRASGWGRHGLRFRLGSKSLAWRASLSRNLPCRYSHVGLEREDLLKHRRRLLHGALAVAFLQAAAWAAASSAPGTQGTATAPTAPPHFEADKQLLSKALQQCAASFAKSNANGPQIQPPKVISKPTVIDELYPNTERVLNHQAVLRVSFLIDPVGNLRFPHIAFALPFTPGEAFTEAAIRLARGYAFSPPVLNGRPIASWDGLPVRFVIDLRSGPMGRMLNKDEWERLLRKARVGDFQSIRAAAYVVELLRSDSGLSETAVQELLVESALLGDDFARLDLVQRLSGCSEGALVDQWIFADANAGSLEAEFQWADSLIGSSDSAVTSKASELLHKLAASPDAFMRLWAAGFLATTPIDGLRDPQVALQVATELNRAPGAPYAQDPDYAELLAAAQAANGQYADAAQSEGAAIQRATSLKWKVDNLQGRLDTYLAGKPWHGYLCDCEQLSTGVH